MARKIAMAIEKDHLPRREGLIDGGNLPVGLSSFLGFGELALVDHA